MRVLKDGTVRYKKAAIKAAEWMQQDPLPMRSFKKRQEVYVFTGAAWEKGSVVFSDRKSTSVWLARKQKTARVCDNRNIKLPEER